MTRTPLHPRRGGKTADLKRYHDWVASKGCIVCRGPATVHHVTASIHGGRFSPDHALVAPLCPRHHQIQHGPRESVEALGHGGFFRTYDIDLEAVAELNWQEWNA